MRNKTVTVVFGEENIVTLIVVEDSTVEKEFLTKYVVADSEITVGGEKYDLADSYEVKVNDVVEDGYFASTDKSTVAEKTYYTYANDTYTKVVSPTGNPSTNDYYEYDEDALTVALNNILGSFTNKAFDKKIEAELTLEDDEVIRIDLFVSMNSTDYNTTEAIVTKVKDEEIKVVVAKNGVKSVKWNEKKYEDKDYPRVYIDGKKSEITDLEVGDVLTILSNTSTLAEEAKNIRVIYASRETAEGEVSRIKNKTDISIDGETYLPSNSTGAFNLDGEIKDLVEGDFTATGFNDIHGEDAILYLNIMGEYVLVNADTVDTDWQFAIVDHIYDVEENEEDEDLYSQKLRLVMMNGQTVRNYKLVLDTEDYDFINTDDQTKATNDQVIMKDSAGVVIHEYKGGATLAPLKAEKGLALTYKVKEDEIIAFKANADGEIELDEVFAVNKTVNDFWKNGDIDGYSFIYLEEDFDDINRDSKRLDITIYEKDKTNGTLTVVSDDTPLSTNDTQIKLSDAQKSCEGKLAAGDKVKATQKRVKVTTNTEMINSVDKETVAWKDLVKSDNKLNKKSILVFEKDKTEVAYLVALGKPAGSDDVQYALVLDATYTSSKTKTEAKLLGVDGEEYIYEYKDIDLVDGDFIAYTVSNNKLSLATVDSDKIQIDLETVIDADRKDELADLDNNYKGAYMVEEVNDDYLTYIDDDDDITVLDDTLIDINKDDVIVVIASMDDEDNVTLTQGSYDEETLKDEYVLFFDLDDDGYCLLVVVK